MVKKVKYFIFILFITVFLFITIKFYFSDNNEKRYYLSLNNINNKLNNYVKKLPILENDTYNIIEYIEQDSLKKKKYNFWKLLDFNE